MAFYKARVSGVALICLWPFGEKLAALRAGAMRWAGAGGEPRQAPRQARPKAFDCCPGEGNP